MTDQTEDGIAREAGADLSVLNQPIVWFTEDPHPDEAMTTPTYSASLVLDRAEDTP